MRISDMSAGTEPARWTQPREGSQAATVAWLDSLASGTCTPEAFLIAMRDQFRGDGEQGWEVLSLLDQYYRRGKIKAEIFQTLKSRLESSAIRGEEDDVAAKPPSAKVPMVKPPANARVRAPGTAATPALAAQQKAISGSGTAVREVAVGDMLRGRYRIRGLIAHGAMGTVFEALDEYRLALPAAGQRLAVKVLHTAVAEREELLFELQRGFQHLQLLSHPNIVRVHEFDRDGDIAFFTMELLTGAPLSGVLTIRNGTGLPRPYALAMIRDIGAALSYSHSRGVVHGDINPKNIFITNEGEMRVLDFGASNKILRDRWAADIELAEPAPVAPPGYASCQLLEGQHPDARDDVFALACVAYAVLSGRHPFPGRTALDARAQRSRPRRPPGITGRQWRVLREGMRWERDQRPSDVQKWLDRFDLASAAPRLPLLPVLVNAPPPRSPSGVVTTAVVTMLALIAAAGFWAVADYDSFARHLVGWSGQARSAFDITGEVPAAAEPSVAVNPAPPGTGAREAVSKPTANVIQQAPATSPAAAPPAAASRAAPVAQTSPSPSPRAAAPTAAGAIRVEMAADTIEVQPAETTAHVIVRRRGNVRGDASFTWWTESGTAKPGQDFAAVTPRVEHIEDGSGGVNLSIPVTGMPRTQPKSFYVVIDRTEGGAALGERTLTMVTLEPAQ
jgi:serine/threonine protein kinase